MDRHLRLLTEGAPAFITPTPSSPARRLWMQLCPLPVSTLADITRNKVAQNTLAWAPRSA